MHPTGVVHDGLFQLSFLFLSFFIALFGTENAKFILFHCLRLQDVTRKMVSFDLLVRIERVSECVVRFKLFI